MKPGVVVSAVSVLELKAAGSEVKIVLSCIEFEPSLGYLRPSLNKQAILALRSVYNILSLCKITLQTSSPFPSTLGPPGDQTQIVRLDRKLLSPLDR